MDQDKLKNFVMNVLVPEGYGIKVAELNKSQLIELIEIANELLKDK